MFSLALLLTALLGANDASNLPEAPGLSYAPPERPSAADAPVVYSFTSEAGPDQSFLLVGQGFSKEVTAWGVHPSSAGGREITPKVQIARDDLLMATLPERSYEGPVVVWAKNAAGFSAPVALNAPELWWTAPQAASPGSVVRLFGRRLAAGPGYSRAWVHLSQASKPGAWLKIVKTGKYQLHVELPPSLAPGEYQLRVHAGSGGVYGWSESLPLVVRAVETAARPVETFSGGNLQEAVDRLAKAGGGALRLPAGTIDLPGTLIVPANVRLQGAGVAATTLVSPADPTQSLATVVGSAWGQGPTGLHTVGDALTYKIAFPAAGEWIVWLRYATEMSPWKQPGVSNRMTIAVAGGEPVPLDNLPNTGSFGTFKWARTATVKTAAGVQEMVWKNVKGGGIQLDAFVFTRDPQFTPGDNPFPSGGPDTLVMQGEELFRMESKDGLLPQADQAAVWLAGDGAGLADLTVQGTARTNLGVLVRSPKYPQWLHECAIQRVKICGCEGKQAENCGVRLFHADGAVVADSEIWGRTPLYFSGIQQCRFTSNRLVSLTLWGGNSEAMIQSRKDVVRECIVENNVCASPPGAEAGGPTGRRMLWFSTGRGSVDRNWIAGNREDRARFGGVAGTDQNVGEMILFEACERIAYYGPLAAADAQSITLPAQLPATPDDRLGSVKREQLAHDAQGNETPHWPPDVDQDTPEPIASEYFVTILRGRGQGQTRQVMARRGETYQLDRPWRVAPEPGCLALVHTAYWRNHIVDNRTVDGMTGVQLWISCIENVVSGNTVARMRKPGLYLYGNCTTLASSMPCTWNRGIGPLYFNHIEGTRCEETSCGALVISGEMHKLPVEFPRCLGNVLRYNSFIRNRTDGLLVTGNRPADEEQPAAAVLGTIAEFNVARDAQCGYHVAQSAEATLLRRNHAYFWYPVSLQPGPYVGFQVDNEKAAAVVEANTLEGIHGVGDRGLIMEQRGPKKPEPTK